MLKKRRLGKTEMMVSELGFGGIPIMPLPEPEAVGVVRHCFDRGINFFDTANMYADSEIKIGQALTDVRSEVYLATKTTERSLAGANAHLELSLKRLGVDYIDLYQLHNLMRPEEIEEAFGPDGAYPAVEKARREGRVKHIGFSCHDLKAAIELCRTGKFSTVQIPFNFIEREPAEELFAAAKENDMGVIAMKPMGGGLLDRVDLCFKFLQQHPEALPIPGFIIDRGSGRGHRFLCESSAHDRRGREGAGGTQGNHREKILPPLRLLSALLSERQHPRGLFLSRFGRPPQSGHDRGYYRPGRGVGPGMH